MRDTLQINRLFIAAHAGFFLLLGYAVLLAPNQVLALVTDDPGSAEVRTSLIRLAGAALGCLALTLLCLTPLRVPEVSRRIVAGLYVGDGFLLFAAIFQVILVGEGGTAGWVALPLLFLVLFLVGRVAAKNGLVAPRGKRTADDPANLQQRWQERIEEAAAQQERNRLARDLHDSIKQQLFSIRIASATVEARWDGDPAGAREALVRVRQSAHEAMVEMQALLLQLRPAALANAGLVEALREQAEALGYRTGAKVEVEVGHLPSDERIPAAAQEALFRIAQEALANVARHARAATVQIRLGSRRQPGGEALVLEVRDDGRGFDPEAAEANRGMGLRNLRDRIQPFGGRVEIASAPGQGTSVEVSLPLAASDPEKHPDATLRKHKLSIQAGLILTPTFSLTIVLSLVQYDQLQYGLQATPLVFAVSYSFWSLANENRPLITWNALERIYFHCTSLWLNPLFLAPVEKLEEDHIGTLPPLILGGFSAVLLLWEAGRYAYRRWRHPEPLPNWRRLAVPILLLVFAVTVILAFLAEDPSAASFPALLVSSVLAVFLWLWQMLEKEEA